MDGCACPLIAPCFVFVFCVCLFFSNKVSEMMDAHPGSEVHMLHRLVSRLPRWVFWLRMENGWKEPATSVFLS
jgi:hypothetical protein